MGDSLRLAIEQAINRYSAENGSNTPDYILAQFLLQCLAAFDAATVERDRWHGVNSGIVAEGPGSVVRQPKSIEGEDQQTVKHPNRTDSKGARR